jgi:lipoprotein-releasing system permease protein
MSFEWLVALRYLRSPNRPAVLRIVTLLAVIGVAAGVTTLVIALSMNTGFRQAIRDRSAERHRARKPETHQPERNP